jgi:hypothetical protein
MSHQQSVARPHKKHTDIAYLDHRFEERSHACACSGAFLHGSRRWAVVIVTFLIAVFYFLLIFDKLLTDGALSVFEHMTNLSWILELFSFVLVFATQLGLAITEMSIPRKLRVTLGRAVHFMRANEVAAQIIEDTRKPTCCAPPTMLGSTLVLYYPSYANARAASDTVLLFFFWPLFQVALVVNYVVLSIFKDNPSLLLHLTPECSTGTIPAGTVIIGNWIYHYLPPFLFLFVIIGVLPDIKAAMVSAAYLYYSGLFVFLVIWNTFLGVLVPFILYMIAVDYKTVYNTEVSVGIALLAGLAAIAVGCIVFWWLYSAALFEAEFTPHGATAELIEAEKAIQEQKQSVVAGAIIAPSASAAALDAHAHQESMLRKRRK